MQAESGETGERVSSIADQPQRKCIGESRKEICHCQLI